MKTIDEYPIGQKFEFNASKNTYKIELKQKASYYITIDGALGEIPLNIKYCNKWLKDGTLKPIEQ